MSTGMRMFKRLSANTGWRHGSRAAQMLAAGAFGWACATSQTGTRPEAGSQTITRVSNPAIDVNITSDVRVSSHAYSASLEEVWLAVAVVYRQLEIPVTVTDRAGWRVGNPQAQTRRIGNERMSRFFECGQASMGRPRADQYDFTYSIFSRLQQATDGRTILLTEADAFARPSSVSTNPVHCSSNGSLEKRIADLVMELLEPGVEPRASR